MSATLMQLGAVWVSKANGRLFKVEAEYPNVNPAVPGSRWKVRRADGATDVLEEAFIYANFTPFNPIGLSATLKDGTAAEVAPIPGSFTAPRGSDA